MGKTIVIIAIIIIIRRRRHRFRDFTLTETRGQPCSHLHCHTSVDSGAL
jgi:hypothetical protein